MGYRATLIDDRAEFVMREHFPNPEIELVAASNWAEAVIAAVGNGQESVWQSSRVDTSEDEQCLRAVMTVELTMWA